MNLTRISITKRILENYSELWDFAIYLVCVIGIRFLVLPQLVHRDPRERNQHPSLPRSFLYGDSNDLAWRVLHTSHERHRAERNLGLTLVTRKWTNLQKRFVMLSIELDRLIVLSFVTETTGRRWSGLNLSCAQISCGRGRKRKPLKILEELRSKRRTKAQNLNRTVLNLKLNNMTIVKSD